MKQTKIRFNLDGLEALKKAVGDTYTARVGILGDKAARTDEGGELNNAEIGVIQMFGSLSANIPPRDFLLMPIQKNKRELVQAMGASSVRNAMNAGDYKKVFQLLGAKAEEFVQMAFETAGFGQWPENAASTIARKGSSRPLIDTSQLRRSITSDVVKKGDKGSQAVTP